MKKFVVFFALLVAFAFPASPAHAAIAFDAATDGGSTVSTSLSWSATVGVAANPILFVCIENGSTAQDLVTSVTYNSVAMTQFMNVTSANPWRGWCYYLVNPATGAHTVAITTSGTMDMRAASVSYTGASQTGVPDSSNSGAQTSNSASISVNTTVVASGSWVSAFTFSGAVPANTIGGVLTATRISNGSAIVWADSNGTVSTGSNTATFSNASPTQTYLTLVFSIAPAASAATPTKRTNAWFFLLFTFGATPRRTKGTKAYHAR